MASGNDGVDVLLVNPPYPMRRAAGIVPPIGLAYLASALRLAGARVAIVDLVAEAPDFDLTNLGPVAGMLEKALLDVGPARLIGIGPLVTANLRSTRELVRAAKEFTSAPVVVGGPLCAAPGVAAVADNYLGVDAYVAGDGEAPIVALWKALSTTGQLGPGPGIRLAGAECGGIYREADLDVLPVPARDLLPAAGYHASARRDLGALRMTAVFLSRGCPYSCSFCAAPLSSGKKVRRFSRPRIEAELKSCADLQFDSLIFYDDCLFVRSASLNERVVEFAGTIAASGWTGTYQLELRCDAVAMLSDRAFEMLGDSGCRQINMGIEKGTTQSLSRLRKHLLPDVAAAACNRLKSTGIRAAGTFILGGVDETVADLEATIDFACGLALDLAHFNPLAIYPGTGLYSEVFGDSEWLGRCLDPDWSPLGDILYRDDTLPLERILAGVRLGYERFYTRNRLVDALNRVSEEDGQFLAAAYGLLAADRANSWEVPVGTSVEC